MRANINTNKLLISIFLTLNEPITQFCRKEASLKRERRHEKGATLKMLKKKVNSVMMLLSYYFINKDILDTDVS